MCKQGALAGEQHGGLGNPARCIFGLHGWPTLDLGTLASRPGPLLAATDDFTVTIKGTQAHGAYPHMGVDPIVTTAQIITALQTIVSRSASPLDAIVVTVGAIHAGTADNIIPETCTFIGTVRTLRKETRTLAKQRFLEVVEHHARAMGAHAQVQWNEGYPVTSNDPALTETFFKIAKSIPTATNIHRVEEPTMGGEDFSYYGHHVPACFFLLGLRTPGATHCPKLHQPDFDFADDAMPLGVRTLCELALRA
jgi:amidohydrolase